MPWWPESRRCVAVGLAGLGMLLGRLFPRQPASHLGMFTVLGCYSFQDTAAEQAVVQGAWCPNPATHSLFPAGAVRVPGLRLLHPPAADYG